MQWNVIASTSKAKCWRAERTKSPQLPFVTLGRRQRSRRMPASMLRGEHLRGNGHKRSRQLLRCLQVGAIGLMGAMASLLVLASLVPPQTALAEYALMRKAMSAIATWIFFPSLGLTLIAGLVAIAYSRAFHNAGWAWLKAASGILVFESGFVGVLGPMQQEAERSAQALAGQLDPQRSPHR